MTRRMPESGYTQPTIADHDGRIVKTTGDGLLVEFASVVDAVLCAVTMQKGMADPSSQARYTSNVLRDLRRINSHAVTPANPILDAAGDLRSSRLPKKAAKKAGARL